MTKYVNDVKSVRGFECSISDSYIVLCQVELFRRGKGRMRLNESEFRGCEYNSSRKDMLRIFRARQQNEIKAEKCMNS